MEIRPREVKIARETKLMSVLNRSSWRILTPFYKTKISACRAACPIHNFIPEWINLMRQGKWPEAYQSLREHNPFPAICGTICHHPCQENCLRNQFDEGVDIRRLEAALGCFGLQNYRYVLPSGEKKKERIAIVGAGPAGLSCAWHLLRQGYQVVLYESALKAGGMLTLAIPEFRLSSQIVESELIPLLQHPNLKIWFNKSLSEKEIADLKKRFDAIFIAVGAHRSKELKIRGLDNSPWRVISGLSFLKESKHDFFLKNKRVVVIGGGNTAIDAARTAKKLRADVTICYRRTENEMPAAKEEIAAAKKEGVKFQFLVNPLEMCENEMLFQLMRLGPADKSGRAQPMPVANAFTSYTADKIITAVGEDRGGTLLNPDTFGNRENDGFFLGGDCLYGSGFVSKAIASGKETGVKIRKYFGESTEESFDYTQSKHVEFKDLNTSYFRRTAKAQMPIKEAERCFSCGLCPENPEICSNCWKFCPDVSVEITSNRPQFDYDHCKGCLICKNECPRAVISKRPASTTERGEEGK